MFGESDSESPRVPSPWDSLISTPCSSSPATNVPISSSPLAREIIPKLVPESDDGNVEYKLQLLSPSPARFARLVTQLKWRLLEGGGQAYYELGVADSGALVGIPKHEMEQTLETLEMMAGEIGASVIVVKEIEVPAALAEMGLPQDDHRRVKKKDEFLDSSGGESSTATEAETETSTTDDDEERHLHDRSSSVSTTDLTSSSSASIFSMDPDDSTDSADAEPDGDAPISASPQFTIDLEIATVFKPRQTSARFPHHLYSGEHGKRGPKGPKPKKLPAASAASDTSLSDQKPNKASLRRQARDRRREEKRKALLNLAQDSLDSPNTSANFDDGVSDDNPVDEESVTRQSTLKAAVLGNDETDALVSGLEALHVPLEDSAVIAIPADDSIPIISLTAEPEEADDVFPTPRGPLASVPDTTKETAQVADSRRLIVEALVVRKMSLEEAFLDFGGFSLM